MTAEELGCSEAGYSLAGKDVHNWYCVIVAARPSLELNQARAVRTSNQFWKLEYLSLHPYATSFHILILILVVKCQKLLRDVKDNLTKESFIKHTQGSPAVQAFGEKRLTLAWLDGSAQKVRRNSYAFNALMKVKLRKSAVHTSVFSL